MSGELPFFLADTWWFALTSRMPEELFLRAARLRAEQGFSAVQLVVGVPPEVGPLNPNARSEAGFPWSLAGEINRDYLALARQRIEALNRLGLLAVVYGAWGHQIRWLGAGAMTRWWLALVEALDGCDVVWCLTGELDLWLGAESWLLPDGATDAPPRRFPKWRIRRLERRRAEWTVVLRELARATGRPILVHPGVGPRGRELVDAPELLAADTLQTGHDEGSREELWRRPLEITRGRGDRCINLEPWYEGIRDRFFGPDQLWAAWCARLAGCSAICYGAQGMWNAGDGRFLAHWGRQTVEEALALETPRLLGRAFGRTATART